ncbi:hypothetical protein IFM89_037934 [Coptis chinensis]|uniref:DNA polymerase epsilon catalytic subunit n=1 Tax=Coptis chinensis TaxID=261450 RepID=A0A835HMX0_9MAGN|nr:hypothetical protein IFM89_037934 [Coptis chinensis]
MTRLVLVSLFAFEFVVLKGDKSWGTRKIIGRHGLVLGLGVSCQFQVSDDGSNFKCKYRFKPYFYATTKDGTEMGVETYLKRCYEGQIADIELTQKEDLNMKNHLSGLQKSYLKISFDTVQQLMLVRNDLLPIVQRNQEMIDTTEAYESILTGKRHQDFIECIVDLREYDVPFHVRFAIDNGDFIATFTSVMSF